MTLSPLQLAKEWERLKGRVATAASGDVKLLLLAEFWQHLRDRFGDSAYRDFFGEYRGLLAPLIDAESMSDLMPEEFDSLAEIVNVLVADSDDLALKTALSNIYACAARANFYVGDIETGMRYAERHSGEQAANLDYAELENLTEIDALRSLIEKLGTAHPKLNETLGNILSEWQLERSATANDTIYSLLVESDSEPKHARGRMKLLHGEAELSGNHSQSDKVTFHNVIVAADDPMIGCAYYSLESVRRLLGRQAIHAAEKERIHANFRIMHTDHKITGSSLGLAFALVSYTQLLRGEALRVERFNSLEVAVTGVVDSDGNLLPVAHDTLGLKIRRAFFSHVRYVVVPQANLEAASAALEPLRTKYPRRQIFLIGAKTLSDVVADHNIIRAEKVCIGEWVGKQIVKYSRMTKVQVPLLVVLGYLLVCLIYPKAWVGFDGRIASATAVGREIVAFNSSGDQIWKSQSFPRNVVLTADTTEGQIRTYYFIADADTNGENELYVVPRFRESHVNATKLYCLVDGKIVWAVETFEETTYPGDTALAGEQRNLAYGLVDILPVWTREHGMCVLTSSFSSSPARDQVCLFSHSGEKLSGPYLHTGVLRFVPELVRDSNNDGAVEVIAIGANNRLDRAVVVLFDPLDLSGVSPPYDNEYFSLSGLSKGSHLAYATLPKTALTFGDDVRQVIAFNHLDSVNRACTFTVYEGHGAMCNNGIIQVNSTRYPAPGICYTVDFEFTQVEVGFPDQQYEHLVWYLSEASNPSKLTKDELEDSLRAQVSIWRDIR